MAAPWGHRDPPRRRRRAKKARSPFAVGTSRVLGRRKHFRTKAEQHKAHEIARAIEREQK